MLRDAFDKRRESKISPDTTALLCRICGKAISVELAKADSDGKPVHEECYTQKVRLQTASNAIQEGKTGTEARHWKVIAKEVTREQNPEKLSELIGELNQALDEQAIGEPASGETKPDSK